jgi:hypothetical protein
LKGFVRVTDIRGEKVVFGKTDYHHLDHLPSARAEDAIVLAVPRRRSWARRLVKLAILLVLAVACAIALVFVSLEEGYLDDTLTARAEDGLSQALGDAFTPEVGAVRLRFSQNWMLAIAAVDVRITHTQSGVVALKTDSITGVLDPLALLRGRIALSRAEIGIAEGDLRFLPAQAPLDWSVVRIDRVPEWLALLYPLLDRGVAALGEADTEQVIAERMTLRLPRATKLGDHITLAGFDFSHTRDQTYVLKTAVTYGPLTPSILLSLDTANGKVETVNVEVAGVQSEPIMMKHSLATGEKRYGIVMPLDFALTAERDRNLIAKVTAHEGLFYADGDAQPVRGGKVLAAYDFKARKLELSDGLIDLGDTVIPLEGTVLDLDRTQKDKPHGFAFEVIGNDGVGSAAGSNEEPERFNASVSGYFLPATRDLQLDRIGVVTASGAMAGSLHVRFEKPSPSVSFAARADRLSVASVKQLWPFWFGKKARAWMLANLKGGTVSNAEIDVSLAAGRIPEHPEPLVFRDNELHIKFDAEDTDVRFFNTMPASTATSGHFLMQGRAVRVDIRDGQIRLPSNKTISGRDGVFSIADVSHKPLQASLDISASAEASALAEFSAFEPINAMARMPFAATDLTGKADAHVKATFGLDRAHTPPPPDWNVKLALKDVALKQPIENRRVSDLDGTLEIDTKTASLTGKADIDGMKFDVDLMQPLAKAQAEARRWQIEGTISEADVLKAAPTLASLFSGSVKVRIEDAGTKVQKARLNLTSASLSLPVIGWRKGPGIAATAEFTLTSKDGTTDIRDLVFDGDGFGARGALTLDRKGVVSAKFSRVNLSNADDFSLNLQRRASGLSIDVRGESIDLRPFLERIKSAQKGNDADKPSTSDTVTATIGRASGHNQEALSSVILKMTTNKGEIATMNFSAVTRSGQAVVINRDGNDGSMRIQSGDAGALARFGDIYRNMNGGLLNISLKAKDSDSWRGRIDIRNFSLVNEARLKSIVSARTGKDGRSLAEAVKADIDVSSQKFRRGTAFLLLDGKQVRVENGVVRGDEVGATFQGTVLDGKGRTDMTGTFMPAYGLNRLFSELPLIGTILGNGRDRGLLGITFKLEGPFDQPKLTVNPLSLIAPGVFRNIFEFE